jgi:thiamine-phosphate pyrophosphorylase
MGACYSAVMRQRHPPLLSSPGLWLVSDARNDALLEQAIARLPRGSGLIFRHYHLPPAVRRARFLALARQIRARGGLAVLAGNMGLARRWGADGAYGAAAAVGPGARGLRLVTVHGLRDIGLARRRRADALVLSPAFATRSHPGARGLGVLGWRGLARHGGGPVIALGGMTAARARRLGAGLWAAIDGLSKKRKKALDDSGKRV